MVLSDTGGILGYGRTRRVATTGQRRALAARDGGCAFPDCTRPAAWCQTHHVTAWVDGGPTDLPNLVLLCGFHHREFAARGWAIRRSAASRTSSPHPGSTPTSDPSATPPTTHPTSTSAHHHNQCRPERSCFAAGGDRVDGSGGR